MKKIVLFALILLSIGFVVADCRLFMMAGYGNENLSNQYNSVYLEEFLDELQDQGDSLSHPYNNPDGWALGFYMPESSEIEDIMRSADAAVDDDDFDDFQDIIEGAGAHLVVGHVRNASSGSTSIPDPHPFIWHENGIDYCFAHNGTLTSGAVTFLTNLLVYPFNQLQTNVDSEVFFRWVMQNISNNDWNVLDGLHDALDAISTQNWNKNFVLSDGVDIYAYRNAIDSTHELCYGKWNELASSPFKDFRIIMSTFPDDMTPDIESTEIPNDALLYYPANGRTALFNNFSDAQLQYTRSLIPGWNWEGMPTIPSTSGSSNAEDLLEDLEDNGNIKLLAQNDRSMEFDPIFETWSHDPITFVNLNWNELYKIAIDDGAYWQLNSGFVVEGYVRPSDEPTLTDIEAGEDYWISYTLLPTQNMDDAFGDEWENVYSVKSKSWTYMDLSYPEGGGRGAEPVPSMKMRALEFGKGYIVRFTDDLDSFTWNYARVPGTVEIPEEVESESFSYTELADYEAIDIMEIEGVENIQEIGVFEDDVCVGAVVTDALPVQIRAYTYNQGSELSFQVVESSRSLTEKKSYSVYNFDRQQYENRSLRSGQQSYSLIKLGRDNYDVIEPDAKISNLCNFPNPFNPTTMISFSLSSETDIELNIYNLKGQLVLSLISGQYSSGSHTVAWDGRDYENKPVSSGLYFYKLKTNDQIILKKMLLLK